MGFKPITKKNNRKYLFILFGSILSFAVCIALFLFLSKNADTCSFSVASSQIPLYLLSGLLGSAISSVIVWCSLENENKVSKIDAHLRLREMFATPQRVKIHALLLLYNNIVIGANQDELGLIEKFGFGKIKDVKDTKKLKAVKRKIEAKLKKDVANLYDYLGIFEIVKDMLDDEILDSVLFNKSYQYRLAAIKVAFDNIEFLRRQKENEGYWGEVCSLIEEYCK